ncbi:Predicted arabinose efflux permease, MFS family [Saccharopolyspora antimicrobica]|uniref:MFS family arabinose efflux permease n=1 Tax=Saccharopolyspora antimicrobica TaxID=455193 RepID=A0A1I4XI18_9PSEU|nr:MFS transporter [Saccharopolyspora antimicrobica]RKT84511.1 putative MFS family arabinose efflux permease [Saccharopolyspora antimicrobica]SFN25246.1 Predicted arabinose efflux permease, MFS family [Saccharopolyspora antimicrobica]
MRRSLGREFGWLWAAYAASTIGTRLAFDAFTLIAVLVLHSSTAQVSALAAAGLAVGALIAVPLGPWVEYRRKRPVMIGMDLVRFVALLSVPAAHLLGMLTFAQLVVVSVLAASANIVFSSASGAYLKSLVKPDDLVVATGRFEATQWTATALGPPLGGAAIGMFGPLTTVLLDATSYLLSALGVRAIGGREPEPRARRAERIGAGEVLEGWRHILRHPQLRLLFFNTTLVNGLIMATSPLVAVLLLRDLGFDPWQYGLAFGVPCIGGLIGSRLAQPLQARFGQHRVLLISGTLRACWSIGLAFVPPGPWGLVFVILIEFGLITSSGVFTPVYAAYRLEQTAPDRIARTLSAWTITSNASIAALTACGGLLAAITGPRIAVGVAGALILCTPFLLPRSEAKPSSDVVASGS